MMFESALTWLYILLFGVLPVALFIVWFVTETPPLQAVNIGAAVGAFVGLLMMKDGGGWYGVLGAVVFYPCALLFLATLAAWDRR